MGGSSRKCKVIVDSLNEVGTWSKRQARLRWQVWLVDVADAGAITGRRGQGLRVCLNMVGGCWDEQPRWLGSLTC